MRCNSRTHLNLTLLEHQTLLQLENRIENSHLFFMPFGVSLYHKIKRQVNGKIYCLNLRMKEQSDSTKSWAVFLYSIIPILALPRTPINFSLSLTSENPYIIAARFVLSSVVLSPLAERHKIKNKELKTDEKSNLLNHKIR